MDKRLQQTKPDTYTSQLKSFNFLTANVERFI